MSDKGQSQRSAIAQLDFIKQNFIAFNREAKPKMIEAFRSFLKMRVRNKEFTPNQKSYIDGMYETAMKGLGLDSYKPIKNKYGVKIQ